MARPLILGAALAAGILYGIGYFTGLWWTVRRLPAATHPYGVLCGSALLRLGLFMGGIALFLDGGAAALAACMTGFLLAREVLVRRFGRQR